MMKKIVIKLGGSALSQPETLKQLAALIHGYELQGYGVVVVHGGGPSINEELTSRGITWQFINGQRQTTPEMMDVIEDVLAEKVNGYIVKALKAEGVLAVGLSGVKHKILSCTPASSELLQVGQVQKVNTSAIEYVLNEAEAIPVIAPVGFRGDAEKFNINADGAAVQIAVALDAEMLIFLTDQDGILDGSRTLVRHASLGLIQAMVDDGTISGGMYTKVMAMLHGLKNGIQKVRVFNAAKASSLLEEPELGTTLAVQDLTKDQNIWIRSLN